MTHYNFNGYFCESLSDVVDKVFYQNDLLTHYDQELQYMWEIPCKYNPQGEYEFLENDHDSGFDIEDF